MALTLFILAVAAVTSPVAMSIDTDIITLSSLYKSFGQDSSAAHGNLRRLLEEGAEKPQLGPEIGAGKPEKVNDKENKDKNRGIANTKNEDSSTEKIKLPKPKTTDVVVDTTSTVEDFIKSDQESVVEEEINGKSAETREEVTEENSDGSDADDKSDESNTGVLAASMSGVTSKSATSGALGSGSVGALLAATALFSLAVLA